LKGRTTDWIGRYEIAHPTWAKVQCAFIIQFNEIRSEGQVTVALRYAKQKKYELVEGYYGHFLQLCVVIPQQLDDINLKEAFRERLRTKVKMAIIKMPRITLA
jgi:hypothetical protein